MKIGAKILWALLILLICELFAGSADCRFQSPKKTVKPFSKNATEQYPLNV